MKTITRFPRKVKETENIFITLKDGTKLACRMWLPSDAAKNPVPAILEYLPYRKRDGTIERDALTHPYLAGHGYAALRVDMRGNGDSDGIMLDEYAQQELDDAVEVIDWIARQKWCTGKVGMMGISWGGFNALQVAAMKPAALKAIVTICSTDDRYADDVHWKGGCAINEMLGWASTMLGYSSRPPDPELVGPGWKKMWLERLKHEPLLAATWLSHPTRDAYWKHGSVCENFASIEAACLIVGGWNDAYTNAVPRLMRGLNAPRRAIIGPWAHKYPHFAAPEPRIGFLQEMLRWWGHWLKGEPTGIMTEPAYRYYIMDAWRPEAFKTEIKGRWVSDGVWGSGTVETKKWFLNTNGIGGGGGAEKAIAFKSPQDTGADGGEYCIIWLGPEFPGDQSADDRKSLCFDTPVVQADMDIVGATIIELDFSVDKPVAFVAARLNNIWPTGESTRITYGLLNLTHKDSHESPEALEPGKRYKARIKLDDVAWRVRKGHRLRVALSTNYWPLMWPAAEDATLTVHAGTSSVQVPVRKSVPTETAPTWQEPEAASPCDVTELAPASNKREHGVDAATGAKTLVIEDDFGRYQIEPHGLIHWSKGREAYSILPGDPLSAKMTTHWSEELKRGRWQIRTEAHAEWTATKNHWLIKGRLEAYEGKKQIFTRQWDEQIERKLN